MMESENKVTDASNEIDAGGNHGNTDKRTKVKVIYKLCDLQQKLVDAWTDQFKEYIPDRVQVYKGDIFKEGPAADAIVSPANSFGFMDGGIDMAYSRHFGWQMQERLQKLIREQYHGELLVGQAAIITTVEHHNRNAVDWSKYNEGQPIKYLISAPTMRVPMDVSYSSNAYLAFRAIILEVEKFNAMHQDEPIRSVLCPGLGTAVGMMPRDRCAFQMFKAFEVFDVGIETQILQPDNLAIPLVHHYDMAEFGGEDLKRGPPKNKQVVKTSSKSANTKQIVQDKKSSGLGSDTQGTQLVEKGSTAAEKGPIAEEKGLTVAEKESEPTDPPKQQEVLE